MKNSMKTKLDEALRKTQRVGVCSTGTRLTAFAHLICRASKSFNNINTF